MMKNVIRAVVLSLPLTFFAADFTPTEQQMVDYVRAHQTQQLSFLEKIVNINSGTQNIKGVTQVGETLKPEFEKLGFKVRWAYPPASMHRAGTLIAERVGKKGKRLLLIAHLDTVFAADNPFQTLKRIGSHMTGPGALDDKGGDVIILGALQAMNSQKALDDATITVVMTGDEEDSGKPSDISRKPLIDVAKNADVALDFEGSDTVDTLSTARRGVEVWEIKTTGKQAHAAQIFQKSVGFGANFEMARILNSVREQMSTEQYFAFNPGLMAGGDVVTDDETHSSATVTGKQNIIAKSALVKGDFRYISPEQRDQAKTKIETIVKQSLPLTSAQVTFKGGIPAMPPTKNNEALLEQYNQISQTLGAGPVTALDPNLRGAGDISYVAGLVNANLVGLGPVGVGGHTQDEIIDIKAFGTQTERAAVFMYRLVNQ